MKVLIACEFSGRVRDAFIQRGHDAISCDLLDTEVPGPHIKGDVLEAIHTDNYDLIIAHPPCTYLANSGVRWLYGGKGKVKDIERWSNMEEAAWFFRQLLTAPAPRVAVENPIMHSYGKELILKNIGLPDYIETIQPWMFGTPETKATQLWLRNLPLLKPTDEVAGRKPRVHFESPHPDRWKNRSRTDINIANAMADQWGVL